MFRKRLLPRAIPLRWILVLPLAIQTGAIAALMGWLSWQSSQQSIEILASQLQRETGSRVRDYLEPRLERIQEVVRFSARSIRTGGFEVEDPEARQQFFWTALTSFGGIDNMAWGDREGNFMAVQYNAQRSEMTLQVTNVSTDRAMVSYPLGPGGQRQAAVQRSPNFDPRRRSWYRQTATARRAIWNPVFALFSDGQTLVLPASYPIYDDLGQLRGVLSARIYLTDLNRFLHRMRLGQSSVAFAMEDNGDLIATSVTTPVARTRPPVPGQSLRVDRIAATDSDHPRLAAIARALADDQNSLENLPDDRAFSFDINGDRHLVRVMSLSDGYGLRWKLVVAIPESEFADRITANKRAILLTLAVALVGSVLLSNLTARLLERPLLRLVRAADELARERWAVHLPRSRIDELDRLSGAVYATAKRLQQAFGDLERQAITDPLTGLLNRVGFSEQLERRLADRDDGPPPFALLFLDLDDFKVVNDTLGHLVGDRLLAAVTDRLRRVLPDDAVLGRFGGDEFIVLLCTIEAGAATAIAAAICQALNTPFLLSGHTVFARTSIGIVHSESIDINGIGDILRDADLALYVAKRSGKDQYACFDHAMLQASRDRFELESYLHQALERHELEVFYQPIIALETCTISGFEALLRWHHPERGTISPAVFIPIAEETGAIIELGDWVLEQACQQIQRWRSDPSLQVAPSIAVNCSIVQLGRADFADRVLAAVERTGLPPSALTIEVTESMLVKGGGFAESHFARLSAAGIQLSMDDFGTGYSSLSYLHRLPFHALKIDRSFIADLGTNPRNASIVRAIVTLAHQLGLSVVAEGVSSSEHVVQLQSLRCDRAQGFLFSPPVPVARAAQLLRQAIFSP